MFSYNCIFQVGLYLLDGRFQCGGSLISPNYVLTSAACTFGTPADQFYVRVGDHNRDQTDGETVYLVATKLEHPSYNTSVEYAFDFSILRLNKLVSLNDFVSLVCLPVNDEEDFAGAKLTISGWGRNDSASNDSSSVLKATSLRGLSNKDCSAYNIIGSYSLCAIESGNSPCIGDGGGK